ncbi:MAG: von Willebrand factor type A domain-containing protein, partial [Victivallales bacterium]|nr:von Willebrand factor type A domain-containing protein [Victivallales bacterium]
MMTEAQLDIQLKTLQNVAPAENDHFASVEEFKKRFFDRAKAIDITNDDAEEEPLSETTVAAAIRPSASIMERLFGGKSKRVASLRKRECMAGFVGNILPSACFALGSSSANVQEPGMDFMSSASLLPDDFNTEEFRSVNERPFVAAARNPLSTFGADVDTAGYTNARRMIMEFNRLPQQDAVRIDEFLNYFRYNYQQPENAVLRPHFEMSDAPWAPEHKLLLVGLQARDIDKEKLPPSNYVFLIDNSGSMDGEMHLVKEAMSTLARQLRPQDKVSVVTYGGQVRVLLEGSGDTKAILAQIAKLKAEGFTPGGEALEKAYSLAHEHFIPGGNNRIVLITDGDFNVGNSSEAGLSSWVEKERSNGIYLSVVGVGMGNYKDNRMKMLANKGDGNYIYLDSVAEARRAFTSGLTGQMYTLAHDVKFQLEFNPARIYAYRLVGYELREMADTDFRDDSKDSGEIGVGQQVTALYEIIPMDASDAVKNASVPTPPPLKYANIS